MKQLLLILATFLLWNTAARADDSPATGTVPAPVPVAVVTEKAPVARKEEDDATPVATAPRENFFQRLFSGNSKNAAAPAADLTALQDENTKLKSRLAALEAENAEQKKQLAHIDANWPAIEAALTAGDSAAPALQTDLGTRVANAVATGTASAVLRSAHAPGKLPGPGADKPDTGKDKPSLAKPGSNAAVSEALRANWAARGYTPPGLGDN